MIGPPNQTAPALASNGSGNDKTTQYTKALIGTTDAAEMIDISKRKLWSLSKCGAIPSHRIDSLVKYSPGELHAWVAAGCPTAPGSGVAVRKGMQQ